MEARRNAQQLHEKAKQCRELAENAVTDEGRSILCEIARRYEQEALSNEAEAKHPAMAAAVS